MNKTFREPLIKWIEISDLSEYFTQRLMMLFAIKDKWTQKELSIFMDDLQINNLKLKQNKNLFCFGTDAVLLANFAEPKKNASVLYGRKSIAALKN